MKFEFIPQMKPWFGDEEKSAVAQYLDGEVYLTEHKKTKEFEIAFSNIIGSKYCFAVNNGTVALTIAGLAINLKFGDEVIIPNYTMIATANAFKLLGCIPKFVDVNSSDYYLNSELIENAISEKTKAIVVMNANGRYPLTGMKQYTEIAKKYGLKLIEDAAQSLGSYYPDGKHIGNHSDISTFSFSAPKIISTGQGGMVCTNDDEIAHKISRLKDFGRSGGGNDVHDTIGYNFKFTDLQAVIGIEQLKKLAHRVQRKKDLYGIYQQNFPRSEQGTLVFNDIRFTSPWFFEVMVEDRQTLIEYLTAHNIGSRPMYPPINKQLAYNDHENHLISEKIGAKGLWLPSQVQLESHQVERICEVLQGFFDKT